jgi:SAM-dependent methyltransferase
MPAGGWVGTISSPWLPSREPCFVNRDASTGSWSPSNPLYDALADDYDAHFAVPHRRAYDDMAWRACTPLWPDPPGDIIDVGCGVGRWASRLIGAGHRVTGIEPAPRMVAAARRRLASDLASGRFRLIESTAAGARLDSAGADVVVAMGSLQYSPDLRAALGQAYEWLRPGGTIAVLVDSLTALVAELARDGRPEEAQERLLTRSGRWRVDGRQARLSLWDTADLRTTALAAGFDDVRVTGLLIGASVYGVQQLQARLTADYDTAVAAEWELSAHGPADLGKQLLLTGRRPPLPR